MKETLHNSFFSFGLHQLVQKRAAVAKMSAGLLALTTGLSSLQAQTPGPELIVAPASGDYAWTTGTKSSHQLNAAGDSIYFLTATDVTTFVPFDASLSTSAACPPAERRVQVNAFNLVLAANNINTISILGTSSGATDRTIRALYVNGVEIPAASYDVVSVQTGGANACGKISVTGLNIPPQAQLTVVIGSSPSSAPQNFRVNVIYINESTLPVKLLDFRAQKMSNHRLLTWLVADGNEPATYTVERSPDGNTFSAIAMVKPNGSNTLSYIDPVAIPGNLVYYRLKITETDGRISYSKVAALNIGTIVGLQLTPNPVTGSNIYLTFGASDRPSTLKVINLAGQVLETRTLAARAEQARIETSQLKPGVYFVQLISSNTLQNQRFVKR